jgi:hypothetical protein
LVTESTGEEALRNRLRLQYMFMVTYRFPNGRSRMFRAAEEGGIARIRL